MKRAIDLSVALVGLALLSPALAAIWILVTITEGRPVLFRQERASKGGRPFILFKFRTMTSALGPDGRLLADEQRITTRGRWLRSTSLDELPELWNVLRGDMSLVGPRPLPSRYLSRYTETEKRRHEVRPGITGWAQVNGRNTTSWDERLRMDVWYVENRSVLLDIKILARTLSVVVRRQGINSDDAATMSELRAHLAER